MLVKKYFNLTENTKTENTDQQAFAEATLVDGTKITNMLEGDFEVGQELHVITAEGEHVLAPEGEHTTESGIVITVDAEGKITGIHKPDEGGEGSLAEEEIIEEVMSSEEQPEKTEMAEEEIVEEMEEHESDVKEAIIEAIAEVVAPEIEALKSKMADVMSKLAEHEDKMKEHMSAPASKPASSSKFSAAKSKIEQPKAVYNVKRYEAALKRITN